MGKLRHMAGKRQFLSRTTPYNPTGSLCDRAKWVFTEGSRTLSSAAPAAVRLGRDRAVAKNVLHHLSCCVQEPPTSLHFENKIGELQNQRAGILWFLEALPWWGGKGMVAMLMGIP